MIDFCDEKDCPLHPDYVEPTLTKKVNTTGHIYHDDTQQQYYYYYTTDSTEDTGTLLSHPLLQDSTSNNTSWQSVSNSRSFKIVIDNDIDIDIRCLMCNKLKKLDMKKIMIAKKAKDILLD